MATPSDGRYYIERDLYGRWVSFSEQPHQGGVKQAGCWWIGGSFTYVHDAINACKALRRQRPTGLKLRVVRDGEVIWSEMPAGLRPIQPQEEHMSDIAQPLHIPRESLITTLQGNLEKEQAARAAANAAVQARRKAAQDAVATLDSDEVLTLIQQQYGSDLDDIVKMVEDAKETGRLKPKEAVPNERESSLEKTVRVLGLANDEEIEIQPTDPIYSLL